MTENSVLLGVPASRGLSSLLRLKMYQINKDEVSSILDTFPIVMRNDEAKYGLNRTKELILSICVTTQPRCWIEK